MGVNEGAVERAQAADILGDAHRRWHLTWHMAAEGWLQDDDHSRQGAINHAKRLALDNRCTNIQLVEYIEDAVVLGTWNAKTTGASALQANRQTSEYPRGVSTTSGVASVPGGKAARERLSLPDGRTTEMRLRSDDGLSGSG